MRSILTLCILLIAGLLNLTNAQIVAVTETGDEVILYTDGTWKYMNGEPEEEIEIPRSNKVYKKSKDATFQLKSKKVELGFWIDPKQWSFKKASSNEDAEYTLNMKGGDVYGMIITEKLTFPIESLKEIVVMNGKSVAPDFHITFQEFRKVNGIEVLCMELEGTTQGISFKYMGYYYSGDEGTVQFVTYSSIDEMNAHKKEVEEFLNGLVNLK